MSENTHTQNQLPDPDAAMDAIVENIQLPAFFNKLAQCGYAPRNQKEAADLLELAGKLQYAAEQQGHSKQAGDDDSMFDEASRDLDALFKQAGVEAPQHDVAARQAAYDLAQDAGIYNAVLSVKAAEAQQVAAQLGLLESEQGE